MRRSWPRRRRRGGGRRSFELEEILVGEKCVRGTEPEPGGLGFAQRLRARDLLLGGGADGQLAPVEVDQHEAAARPERVTKLPVVADPVGEMMARVADEDEIDAA